MNHDKSASSEYIRLLIICCGITFGCYFAAFMRLPVVPLYARSFGINTAQIGIIASAFFLMAGLLSLPLGILSDRVGRKQMACYGMLLLSGALFLLCFGKTFPQLAAIHILLGAGMAAFGPTMMSFVADISPVTHLGRSYGWYTTALFTGMSIGPAVGGFIGQEFGFIQTFMFSGIFIFLNLWGTVFFMPNPGSDHDHQKEKRHASAVAKEFLKNYPLLGCWLTTLGGCFGLGMFMSFIPLHAQNQGLTVRQIGFVFSAQGLFNAISRIPFGNLSDRINRRSNLVIIGLMGFAASMAGFGMSENIIHFIIFAITLGISMGLAFTSIGALIAETVSPEFRGLAMGGYNTCIYFGMMLSSATMGTVIQSVGFRYGFFIISLIILALIGFFYLLIKDFRPVREQA